ncbi:MAG: hypothetical protein MUC96_08675 [Myxococcaceae bacterium]|nr:hypothetical protein [Myxococcaceae bacterium]
MVKGACIYVEGADREDLRRSAREAFTTLFAPVMGRRRPRFIFCGPRQNAFAEFEAHLEQRRREPALLLVDAEDVVEEPSRWNHVRKRKEDKWERPTRATEDDLRFMAVVMESWCIAGSCPHRELERIPKNEVEATLKKTGWTKAGSNSFELVRRADLALLCRRSPEFNALCERLRVLTA